MDVHWNASGRELMVRRVLEGWAVSEPVHAAAFSRQTVYRWIARWAEGGAGLRDRSSRPHPGPDRDRRSGEGPEPKPASVAGIWVTSTSTNSGKRRRAWRPVPPYPARRLSILHSGPSLTGQGGALRPKPAPRMGLRLHRRQLLRKDRSATDLLALPQSSSSPLGSRAKVAHGLARLNNGVRVNG